MKVLAVDIGGTNVKILASGEKEPRKFPSGPHLTPREMVAGVKKLARGWKFDAVSMGYPGMVIHNHPVAEPRNLGRGWIGWRVRKSCRAIAPGLAHAGSTRSSPGRPCE